MYSFNAESNQAMSPSASILPAAWHRARGLQLWLAGRSHEIKSPSKKVRAMEGRGLNESMPFLRVLPPRLFEHTIAGALAEICFWGCASKGVQGRQVWFSVMYPAAEKAWGTHCALHALATLLRHGGLTNRMLEASHA